MTIVTFMRDLLKTATRSGNRCDESVQLGNISLPPAHMRQCTAEFRNDEFFVESIEREVHKLAEHCGLNDDSRVLEIGCGSGRLPIGLMSTDQSIESYVGVDVDAEAIRWCKR